MRRNYILFLRVRDLVGLGYGVRVFERIGLLVRSAVCVRERKAEGATKLVLEAVAGGRDGRDERDGSAVSAGDSVASGVRVSLRLAGAALALGGTGDDVSLAGSGLAEGGAGEDVSLAGSGLAAGGAGGAVSLAGSGLAEGGAGEDVSLAGSGLAEGGAGEDVSLAGGGSEEGEAAAREALGLAAARVGVRERQGERSGVSADDGDLSAVREGETAAREALGLAAARVRVRERQGEGLHFVSRGAFMGALGA